MAMIEVDDVDSYEAVRDLWKGLNERYKGGELALDWEIHNRIWTEFHAVNGCSLRVFIGFDAGECIGIFPLAKLRYCDCDPDFWVLGEDSLISREYFCHPARLGSLIPLLPLHEAIDLSCFYTPDPSEGFMKKLGCVVDLKLSEEEYLDSMDPKARSDYLKTLSVNDDIEVAVENSVRDDVICDLKEKYIEFWMKKIAEQGRKDATDSRLKTAIDLEILKRAAEMGKLVALHFFLDGKLLAANFSVLRENNRVDDYLCLRDTDNMYAKRRLGILAIIRNMQICRALGVRYYDFSSFRSSYKEPFINTDLCYFTPLFSDTGARAAGGMK